jgi:serine protease Do
MHRPFGRFAVAPVIAALLMLAAPAAFAHGAPDSFADMAEKLLPAVVNIATTQKVSDASRSDPNLEELFKKFFDRQNRGNNGGSGNGDNGGNSDNGGSGGGDSAPHEVTSLGSGFIIDPAGYIVTNNHVIEGAEEITVRLQNNTEYKAKLVGHDPKTDLALLKVDAPAPLPAVEWGDSDKARIGDWVLAIGNPFGLGGTVTAGIVSARQRDINAGPYDDFIQTDAPINRGNSGGPMFDMDGKVIGINTAIFSPSGGSIGIGFALPSSLAKGIVAQLRQFGHPRRGWLGVRIQSVTPELAQGLKMPKPMGALIAAVTGGGPADKAGIKRGDVVIRFNNQDIGEMRHLPLIVAETPFDTLVPVTVLRQGKEMKFQVKLGELDETAEAKQAGAAENPPAAPKPADKAKAVLGLSLAEMSKPLRQKFSIADEASGVVVLDVDAKSNASIKGLKPGDVIVEVDQSSVAMPADVEKKVAAAKANGLKVVTLLVYRQGDFQWVALRIDQG